MDVMGYIDVYNNQGGVSPLGFTTIGPMHLETNQKP